MLETKSSERASHVGSAGRPSRGPSGEWNRRIGWVCACLGAATGLILGLWSFDGPLAVPGWLGEYDQTSRRLARLGHIAFFGLGILNILLAGEMRRTALGSLGRRVASWAMNFGNVFLPLTLFAAAAYRPLKYSIGAPALAVFIALAATAYGACCGKMASEPEGPGHETSA
jgi:hypothetical protein